MFAANGKTACKSLSSAWVYYYRYCSSSTEVTAHFLDGNQISFHLVRSLSLKYLIHMGLYVYSVNAAAGYSVKIVCSVWKTESHRELILLNEMLQ